MPRALIIFLAVFFCGMAEARSPALEFKVTGVSSSIEKNVVAWLGIEPETPEERANFLASVDERVLLSLQAIGYYRPGVTTALDKQRNPWQLTINIEANEPVRIAQVDIDVEGEATSDPAFIELMKNLPLSRGDVLHHGHYEDIKRRLQALGQQRGYFTAAIKHSRVEVNADRGEANVSLLYSSGPRYRYGEIRLDDSVMDMSWIDAVINFEEGDLFELQHLQRLRAELQQTRFFSSVVVRPMLNQLDQGTVPVEVAVSPANRHSFEFGVGFSTDTQERVSVTWRTPLLNRYGHSQETRLEYSPVRPSGRFTYNIPLSHPINDVLLLTAYLEDREYADVDSRQQGFQVRREMKRDDWVWSYSFRTLDESWGVGLLDSDNSYVLPGATLSHKSRSGSLVDPEAGLHQVYIVEAGGEDIGSDIDLLRFYSNFRLVVPIAPQHRMVGRIELGAVFIHEDDRDNLAPSLSFFTGGSQSIRGFSYQSIGNEVELEQSDGTTAVFVVGGDRLVTASMEYQYYFTETWRGALFVDAGDAFDDGEFEAHYGGGFGVHYMSPVGAIRLELANNLSEENPSWRLHINIGAEF